MTAETAPAILPRQQRFARFNLSARIGAGLVFGFTLVAICAPLLAPYDPLASDWAAVLQAPTTAHPMGTDDLGRDVLSRAIWGAQTSLIAGVASVLIALGIGVPLGIFAGYFRGWIDTVVTRLADTLLACPQIMLAIALAMFLGGSLLNASIAIGISTVPVFVRLARAKTIEESSAVYIEAAVAVGNPTRRLLFVHLLPNIVPPLIVQAALATATAIIAEAGLSFLGLGRELPAPSWGSMLTVGKDYIANAPWLSVWPGLCICLAVIGFNLLGDGLRRVMDPRP
jgi:peptide/nickel transport system permease protein